MIFDLIPDGIVAVDRELAIIRLNHSARRLLGIREDAVCEGKAVASVMEEDGFRRLLGGRRQYSDTIRLAEKNIWLERLFRCDREKSVLLCVMRDVTGQKLREERIQKDLRHALELADTLNERHLRTVREVSGLLGENAADTQILLRERLTVNLSVDPLEHGQREDFNIMSTDSAPEEINASVHDMKELGELVDQLARCLGDGMMRLGIKGEADSVAALADLLAEQASDVNILFSARSGVIPEELLSLRRLLADAGKTVTLRVR